MTCSMMLGTVNSLLLYKAITHPSLFVSSISDEQPRGRGYWKFNNLLTQDKVFVKTLKQNINEWVSALDEQQDPRVNWELLKHKIFRFSKQYANEQVEKRKVNRVH